jgi:hypothetical protein
LCCRYIVEWNDAPAVLAATKAGLYKLNSVLTHSFKAPGFNH